MDPVIIETRDEGLFFRSREESFILHWLVQLVHFTRKKPLGAACLVIIIVLLVAAALAPVISPHDPSAIQSKVKLTGLDSSHWFGTDNFGRDVFSRVLYGSRVSLYVGFGAVLIGGVIACSIGIFSGYVGGLIDTLIQRIVDAVMAFPTLVFLMAIVSVIGPGLNSVTIILGVIFSVGQSRIIRSSVLSVRQEPYIEAAQVVGASGFRVVRSHIFPNVTAPLIVVLTTALGAAILAEASLSFLGLGVPPPLPSWGQMLSIDSRQYMLQAPWMAIFPGAALSMTVFSFNMLGDALRDVLDPRLRGAG
jgi:peptide/nickel transport system permease protein